MLSFPLKKKSRPQVQPIQIIAQNDIDVNANAGVANDGEFLDPETLTYTGRPARPHSRAARVFVHHLDPHSGVLKAGLPLPEALETLPVALDAAGMGIAGKNLSVKDTSTGPRLEESAGEGAAKNSFDDVNAANQLSQFGSDEDASARAGSWEGYGYEHGYTRFQPHSHSHPDVDEDNRGAAAYKPGSSSYDRLYGNVAASPPTVAESASTGDGTSPANASSSPISIWSRAAAAGSGARVNSGSRALSSSSLVSFPLSEFPPADAS